MEVQYNMSNLTLKAYIIGYEEELGLEPPPNLVAVPSLPPVLSQIVNAEIQGDLLEYIERHVDIVQGGDF